MHADPQRQALPVRSGNGSGDPKSPCLQRGHRLHVVGVGDRLVPPVQANNPLSTSANAGHELTNSIVDVVSFQTEISDVLIIPPSPVTRYRVCRLQV